MRKISKEEHDLNQLIADYTFAETDSERELAKKEIEKFEKEHPVLVDEIQSRRWVE